MTKSTITRERLEELAAGQSGFNLRIATLEESQQLARMALAAMDTEPVILYRERNPYNGLTTGWQELTENEFSFLKENAGENAEFLTLYRHAQQPVVPEEWTIADAVKFCKETGRQDAGAAMDAWNACRAAMLQVSPVCTCPSGDGSLRWPCPVHPGNSPAQSDCCPAQNSVNPAQGGNYLVIPDEMTSEQAYEIGYYYGDPVNVFARGANWMRQHIIDSTLAAAPHDTPALNSVQSVVTVPGKWIPVSEQKPDCWCLTCRPVTLNDMRFVVCPDCGNKRCPRANDHRNACTRSNEPGQEGSAYPAAPQEVRGE